MFPQFLPTASEDVLRGLATQLFAAEFLPESAEKSAVISTLLSAGITKAAFFKPPSPPQQAYYPSWNRPSQPQVSAGDRAELAKRYVQTCIVLGCPELVGNMLDKVGDTSALEAKHAQECARTVMLPVVAACVERMRGTPESVPKEKFEKLKENAVKLYFEWFIANTRAVTRPDVVALINAVVVDGNAATFVRK